MIQLFRRLRRQLLTENKLTRYIVYAIGEIVLIVIGILIAVGIGEWRADIKREQEQTSYYEGLYYDLSQDVNRLDSLIVLFGTASSGIFNEIDKIQLPSYNIDSLYSNVPAWMLYITEFTPTKPTFTEILSSGKLQLIQNEDIKTQLLKIYTDLYPEVQFRQEATNEYIRTNRTEELMDTYRWLEIVLNDGQEYTNVPLQNPMFPIEHNWINNKQSEKFLRFENYLTVTGSSYQGFIIRYRKLILEINHLLQLLEDELENE